MPEAQLDRFLCKLHVTYPSKEELKAIIKKTTGTESTVLTRVASVEDILHLQSLVKQILVADDILDIAVNIVSATHPGSEDATELGNKYIQAGSGPRGLQSLVTMAKARALASGRLHVSMADLRYAALPVFRHRILLNFEGKLRALRLIKLWKIFWKKHYALKQGREDEELSFLISKNEPKKTASFDEGCRNAEWSKKISYSRNLLGFC
ncbi:MoxR family ATPase [Niallia circulans]